MHALWAGRWEPHFAGAPTPDGTAVLDETDSGGRAHLALVGTDGRGVEDIGTIDHPTGAQYTYTAVNARWVAFAYVLTNQQQA